MVAILDFREDFEISEEQIEALAQRVRDDALSHGSYWFEEEDDNYWTDEMEEAWQAYQNAPEAPKAVDAPYCDHANNYCIAPNLHWVGGEEAYIAGLSNKHDSFRGE